MKKSVVILALLSLPAAAPAQELPKADEAGKKAAAELLAACEAAGALRRVPAGGRTPARVVVADATKLKEAARRQRKNFTPAARDALVGQCEHPGVIALLLRLGQEAGDPQAVAFATFYSARLLDRQLKYREARRSGEQAARLFEQLKMTEWHAVALNNLASACRGQGDLPQARRFAEQALALRRQALGECHPDVAQSLNNLALVCHEQGDLPRARDLAEQALEMRRRLHGERHADVALSLDTLALVCHEQGDLPRARDLFQQALDLRRKLFGERHPDVAASLSRMVLVCRDQGDLPRARRFAEQALELRRKLFGERHTSFASSLRDLAVVCRDQGDLPQARRLLRQELGIRKEVHGGRHPSVAACLGNLAAVCADEGDLPQAREFAEQALELRRKLFGERHPDVATSLHNLAVVCHDQGDLPQARRLAEQALELRRQLFGERHPAVAGSLNGLALVCRDQGERPRARRLLEEALSLRKQLYGERHPRVAQSLNNLGLACHDQGDLPRARRLFQEALELRRRLHGGRHPSVAACLSNLAVVCRDQRDLPQARQFAEQALGLLQEIHGERHPDVATALNTLAGVCRAEGDLPRARGLTEQALGLRKQLFGERHPAVALSLGNLARLCHEQGDRPKAVEYGTAAVLASRLPHVTGDRVDDLRADDLTCDPATVLRLTSRGWFLQGGRPLGLGAARQAAHSYSLAADLLDRLRADVLETEEGKLAEGARRADLAPTRVALCAGLFRREGKAEDLRAAFAAAEQGRARVFLEALLHARSGLLGGVPEPLLQRERDLLARLRGVERRIQKENGKPLGRRDAGLVDGLFGELKQRRGELDRFAGGLRRDYPQYAALRYPRPCTLEQARDCLRENEVAVLFALGRRWSYAVVVQKRPAPGDKGQGVAVVPLPGAEVLAPKVRTLTDPEVLRSDSRCRRLGAELHELLLKPLAPHVGGKDLVLSPDGVLWELPFELLVEAHPGEGGGRYLVEARQVRYTPSLTVLHLLGRWEKARAMPPEPLWALGDPVFSERDPRARGGLHRETRGLLERYALRGGGAGAPWGRLRGTRAEVEAVGRLLGAGPGDVVTDDSASERALKSASEEGVLARKRYVHLATHGVLGGAPGRPPSLVLSLVGNGGEEQLGGANDGFLTMPEVTHLRLNADLVVLSACETGKGDLQPAEGVVGLSRAFLYAGSRGVVCSLWQVDDERTAGLMRALYGRLKEGRPAAEALALARRGLIAEERAPFYWAPFVLIGK